MVTKGVFMRSSVDQSGGVSRRSLMALSLGGVAAGTLSGPLFATPAVVDAPKPIVRMVVIHASHGSTGFSDLKMALAWADRRVGQCDLISCLGWDFASACQGAGDIASWSHLKSSYVAVAGQQPRLFSPDGECNARESSNGTKIFVTDLGAIAVGDRRSNAIEGAQFSADIIVGDRADYSKATGSFVAGLSPFIPDQRSGAVIYGPDAEPLTQASGERGYGVVATLNLAALRHDRFEKSHSGAEHCLSKRIS